MDKTSIYNVKELKQELILLELVEIVKALEEKNYNAVNQISGYLLTGDETYITSYNDARKKILKFKQSEVLSAVLSGYLSKLWGIWLLI